MVSRQHTEQWQEGVQEFWEAVTNRLPDELKHRAATLREAIEGYSGDTEEFDPEVIYHRTPQDVAEAIESGGYEEIGAKTATPHVESVREFLRDQGLDSYVDADDRNARS